MAEATPIQGSFFDDRGRLCVTCAEPLPTGPRSRATKYCSRPCSIRAHAAERVRSGRTKSVNLSDREKARRKAYQAENAGRWCQWIAATCVICGGSFERRSDRLTTMCSSACVGVSRSRVAEAKRASSPRPSCSKCGIDLPLGRRMCDGCRLANSPLRIALEARDLSAIQAALLDKSVVDGLHWIWQGRAPDGYPIMKWSGKSILLHRAIVAAIYGEPGAMPVHHTCGHSLCVNPDHLQVVTPIENTAEMLERQWYLDRIKQLEDALAAVKPGHQLLAVPLLGADPRLWERSVA